MWLATQCKHMVTRLSCHRALIHSQSASFGMDVLRWRCSRLFVVPDLVPLSLGLVCKPRDQL